MVGPDLYETGVDRRATRVIVARSEDERACTALCQRLAADRSAIGQGIGIGENQRSAGGSRNVADD